MEVDLPLKRYNRGKVRDTFEVDGRLLMVASDRISAFDVVMPNGIPDKGVILTQMSLWWFAQLSGICPNHLCDGDWPEPASAQRDALEPRSMLVRKAERIDIECVIRGYLAGSGWAEYSQAGTLAGLRLPAGLGESERLPHPQFTPATKNDLGHDQNISIQEMADRVGTELTIELQTKSIDLYNHAAVTALERGVILADTKLEFGYIDGELSLIDECFTPDSSRYWDAEMYEPGVPQPSMDKQFLRDWLDGLDWNKQPPAPRLPDEVVAGTRQRYLLAYKRITGGGL
jgi:phosphoribosylaminoimidazole-succinocarboxamide synthase